MQGRWTTIKYLDQKQTARFFSVIKDARDRALFAVIYFYGLRVAEATLLQLENVDLVRRRIFISRVKSGLGGERPLFSNAARLLKTWGDEFTPQAQRRTDPVFDPPFLAIKIL